MVWELPDVMRISYAFVLVMLCWMALWSFGVSGIVAFGIPNGGQWWLLLVSGQVFIIVLYQYLALLILFRLKKESLLYLQIFSVSLFWTGAVLSNTVHVIVSGMVFLVLIHGGPAAATMPPKPVLKSIQYAVTTSFGSICYGSLFTAAIRTLRWEVCTFTSSCFSKPHHFFVCFYPYPLSFIKLQIRGIRSKIGNNECLLCCIDFLFHIVETLVRFFNKYAYVQVTYVIAAVIF